jgi:hypothetical protein
MIGTRVAAALLLLPMVAGCVTTAGEVPPDVGNYRGQASQPVLAKLGPPDSQEATATTAIYRWRTSVLQESAPVTTTTVIYSNGVPQTVPVQQFRPQTQYCTLEMTVDVSGRIVDFVRDGSRQACAPLTAKLTSP